MNILFTFGSSFSWCTEGLLAIADSSFCFGSGFQILLKGFYVNLVMDKKQYAPLNC